MITVQNEALDKHRKKFMQQLGALKADTSIAQFLLLYFAEEKYASLRRAVKNFAEGFDLADTSSPSAIASYREWAYENETYRIPGGYSLLINFLLNGCYDLNGSVYFNSVVAKIEYNKESVTVYSKDNKSFKATK